MLFFPRWKIALVVLVAALGIAFAAPNVVDSVPGQKINLGLDLQGGSHLLLEVDADSVERETLDALVDESRTLLRRERLGWRDLSVVGEAVVIRPRDPKDAPAIAAAIRTLAQPVQSSLFNPIPANNIDVTLDEDRNLIRVIHTEADKISRLQTILARSIEIIRRRVDELGTTEPSIQRQGKNRIILEVPGLDDPERLKAIIGKTAKLNFHLVDIATPIRDALAGRTPPTSRLLYSSDEPSRPIVIRRRVIAAGDNLVDAQAGFDDITREPQVNFRFDSIGARSFGEATRVNVGRPFAIVLDNKVISAPVIQEAILGGSGRITRMGSTEEAADLALLLRAGALPAPLTILEERTVGPGLGADSIRAGALACIVGLLAVLVFMSMAYGLFGVFANIALILNLVLLMGALSLLQATLTLPGIAGLVLTIGMAVDANVLVFERIREERAAGRNAVVALQNGYERALITILDANITTFIAAATLFFIGSGPVRGFAVTLSIGIATSVFTAFTVTRLFIAIWVRLRRPQTLPIDTPMPKVPHAL